MHRGIACYLQQQKTTIRRLKGLGGNADQSSEHDS